MFCKFFRWIVTGWWGWFQHGEPRELDKPVCSLQGKKWCLTEQVHAETLFYKVMTWVLFAPRQTVSPWALCRRIVKYNTLHRIPFTSCSVYKQCLWVTHCAYFLSFLNSIKINEITKTWLKHLTLIFILLHVSSWQPTLKELYNPEQEDAFMGIGAEWRSQTNIVVWGYVLLFVMTDNTTTRKVHAAETLATLVECHWSFRATHPGPTLQGKAA